MTGVQRTIAPLLALFAAVLLGNCDGKTVLQKTEALVESGCACSDVACVEGAIASIKKLERGKEPGDKFDALDTKIEECQQDLAFAAIFKEFEGLVDTMCACKDMACVESTLEGMDKFKDAPEPNEAQKEKIEQLSEKMAKCVSKLATAGD